ncbi:MAG: BON domain-containing protein [Acidimicrobiales bacterium]|nr:BON domain-containing protein [Acidimicrobiales bacterium]
MASDEDSRGVGPADDDEKLIPGWGLAADAQIIVLGLLVLGLILGSLYLWPRLFGSDSPAADIVPELPAGDDDGDDPIDDEVAPTTSAPTTTVDDNGAEVDLTPEIAGAVSGFAGVRGAANGTVAVLEGFVGTIAESQQAEEAAAAVDGVTDVDNRLVVLEQQVLDAVNQADAGLSEAAVQMNGTSATLRGLVSNELDAASAISAAEAVEGISPPVIDELRILQPEVDAAIAELGFVEGGQSPVETDSSTDPVGRVVTLTGSVSSDEESSQAEAAARAVDGVTDVVNRLEVTGPSDEEVTADLNDLFELSPIQFRSGSDVILDESLPTLDNAIGILTEASADIRLEVQGYTDTSGGTEANQRLSERRAAAVRQYLVEGGVNGAILTSKGFGETTQFGPELADNRRVRFALL